MNQASISIYSEQFELVDEIGTGERMLLVDQKDDQPGINKFLDPVNEGSRESIRLNIGWNVLNPSLPSPELTALEEVYQVLGDIKTAFSDLKLTIQNLYNANGLVKGILVISGTHDGVLWGVPASGAAVGWKNGLSMQPAQGDITLILEKPNLPEVLAIFRQVVLLNPPEMMDVPPANPVVIPEIILKILFTGQVSDKSCSHLDANTIRITQTAVSICPDCAEKGDVWAALRMCLTCGYVGCCETSKNRHSKQHYLQTGHPLMRSIYLNESWVWCYQDEAFFPGRLLERFKSKDGTR